MNDYEAAYTVTGVTDVQMFSPQTGAQNGKRVTFRFHDGTVSHVDIPLSEYNAQNVLDKIHAMLLVHEQVMSIQGPPANTDYPNSAPRISDLMT